MASKRYEDKHRNDPPVKVEHRQHGCPIDERRDKHEHTQADWREVVDNTPMPWARCARLNVLRWAGLGALFGLLVTAGYAVRERWSR